jgi:hypothetical protein
LRLGLDQPTIVAYPWFHVSAEDRIGIPKYAREILIEDDATRRVTSDELFYFSPYVGMGTSLVQTRHLHLGAQLIGRGRLYGEHTQEGLANDLFKDGAFVLLLFETTLVF